MWTFLNIATVLVSVAALTTSCCDHTWSTNIPTGEDQVDQITHTKQRKDR